MTRTDQEWRDLGANAARKGYAVTASLTTDKAINALIREGYASATPPAPEKEPT